MKEFKAAMAKADVTPEVGCLLYGYAGERRAKRIMDRLEVGVTALNQNNETVLLISAEVCAINLDVTTSIRAQIAEATGVKSENILYSAIHTHSGPITRTSIGWGITDMDYMDNVLIPASIKAAKEALSSLKPAVVGIGTIDSYAGINRREVTKDGEIILGQNPDASYDPTMTLMYFKTVDGEPIGTVIHFAAHATAAGRNPSITRDWPGIMIDRMKEVTGAPCMYVNGAEGNVGPRLSNGKTTGDESHVYEVGEIAANDAEKAYNSIKEFKVPELKIKNEKMNLIFGAPKPLEIVEAELAKLDPDNLIDTDITKHYQLSKIKAMYESGEEFAAKKEFVQTVIAIDDLAIVPFPFECFNGIALELREKSPFKDTILFGLTGGSYGYLPTEDQIPLGGYEIASFRAATIPSFADNLANHLVSENLNLLNKLYENK